MDKGRQKVRRRLVPIGTVLIGFVAGLAIACLWRIGGVGGSVAAYSLVLGLLAAMVAAAVLRDSVAKSRKADMGRARRATLVDWGLLVVGAIVGAGLGLALIQGEPVALEAGGHSEAFVTDGPLTAGLRTAGSLRCYSVAGTSTVAFVEALDLGTLGAGTLRATIALETLDAGRLDLELRIHMDDPPEGAEQPAWTASASVDAMNEDRTDGQVTFVDAARVVLEPGASQPPSDWPATLSGTIAWVCNPW